MKSFGSRLGFSALFGLLISLFAAITFAQTVTGTIPVSSRTVPGWRFRRAS